VRTALKQRANNLGLVSEGERQTDREQESETRDGKYVFTLLTRW